MKVLYNVWGLPRFEMEIPDKKVICARCFCCYNLKDAPVSEPEKLRIKEPHCPNCKYKWYLS